MSRILVLIAAVFIFLAQSACQRPMKATPQRDINTVLNAHSQELMALPSVTGVYVGLMPDEKTPCLKVMLKEKNSATIQKIPKQIEGHPVRVEISGEIRPMK
jgi:hypothetical protein